MCIMGGPAPEINDMMKFAVLAIVYVFFAMFVWCPRVIEKGRSAETSAQLNRSQQRTSDEQGRKCHPHENPEKQAFSIPLGHHPCLVFCSWCYV